MTRTRSGPHPQDTLPGGSPPAFGGPIRLTWMTAAVLLWIGGCVRGTPPPPPEHREEPHKGGTLHMAQSSPGTLDPACLDDVYEASLVNQLFEGLLSFDANLNVVPCIAESWRISRDGQTYTFLLKQGVLFHDGTEVTADDFVYSFTRVFDLDPRLTNLAREYLSHIEGSQAYADRKAKRIAGLTAVSPYELRITLDRPFASFLAVLAMEMSRVVPSEYAERVGADAFSTHPVGSGPFQLAAWDPDRRIVMTAFDRYHQGRAHLDSLVFDLPTDNAREYAISGFLSGRLDAVVVPEGRLAAFRQIPTASVVLRQELSLTFLAMNQQFAPFDDARVRRAFAMAIDHERLRQVSGEELVLPTGIMPPGMPGYAPEPRLARFDQAGARELLSQAGFGPQKRLPRIVHTTSNESAVARRIYEEIAKQLAAVGFQMTTEYQGWLEFDRRLRARELQCFSLTWVADIPDPDSFLYPLFHTGGSANFTFYDQPAVNELLKLGRNTRSTLERWDLYRGAERRILEDSPVVPLFHPQSVIAVRENVRDLVVTPMGVGSLAMEHVWLQPIASDKPRSRS